MLRMIQSEELNYFQEPPSIVSKRAKRFLEILNNALPIDEVVSVKSLRKFLSQINVSKSKSMSSEILYNELSVLSGSILSAHERMLLACSIAGAWRCDLVGHANIRTMEIPDIDVWAKIVDIKSVEIFREKGYSLTFVICNSSMAGNRVMDEVDFDRFSKITKYMGIRGDRRRQIRKKEVVWHNPMQAVGGAVVLRISKVGGQIRIAGVGFHSRTKEYNKNLAIARDRRFTPCPYNAQFHCAQCRVGVNECELSCINLKTKLLEGKK